MGVTRPILALACLVVILGCSWECDPGETKHCLPTDPLCDLGEAVCLNDRTWGSCRCIGPPWDIAVDPDAPPDLVPDPGDVPTDPAETDHEKEDAEDEG